MGERTPRVRCQAVARRQHDVVQDRHAAERPHDLVRERGAPCAPAPPSRRRDVGAAQDHATGIGRRMPATIRNSVVLPAPFGPIRPMNSPSATARARILQRLNAAEADRDVSECQHHCHGFAVRDSRPLNSSARPPGASRITRISRPPEDQQPIVVAKPDRLRQQRERTVAAAVTPQVEPMPPITTIVRSMTDTMKSNVSTVMNWAK